MDGFEKNVEEFFFALLDIVQTETEFLSELECMVKPKKSFIIQIKKNFKNRNINKTKKQFAKYPLKGKLVLLESSLSDIKKIKFQQSYILQQIINKQELSELEKKRYEKTVKEHEGLLQQLLEQTQDILETGYQLMNK